MKIAIHQMCSGTDPAQNASKMVDAIAQAGGAGAAFYFAPEMSLMLDRDRQRSRPKIFSETETGQIRQLCEVARKAGIWVHLGSIAVLHEDGSGRLANRSLVIDGGGNVRARYDKMHMFDVNLSTGEQWRESAAYRAGDEMAAARTPFGLLGLAICYDLRFAELFVALSQAGADFIAVPSAFTRPTGQAHWEALLKSRAIETQCFVIAAAQSGIHEDGRSTYGHSLVIGPWGDIIADLGDAEGLAIVELDLSKLHEVRSQIPIRQNRRPGLGDVTIFGT